MNARCNTSSARIELSRDSLAVGPRRFPGFHGGRSNYRGRRLNGIALAKPLLYDLPLSRQ